MSFFSPLLTVHPGLVWLRVHKTRILERVMRRARKQSWNKFASSELSVLALGWFNTSSKGHRPPENELYVLYAWEFSYSESLLLKRDQPQLRCFWSKRLQCYKPLTIHTNALSSGGTCDCWSAFLKDACNKRGELGSGGHEVCSVEVEVRNLFVFLNESIPDPVLSPLALSEHKIFI